MKIEDRERMTMDGGVEKAAKVHHMTYILALTSPAIATGRLLIFLMDPGRKDCINLATKVSRSYSVQ